MVMKPSVGDVFLQSSRVESTPIIEKRNKARSHDLSFVEVSAVGDFSARTIPLYSDAVLQDLESVLKGDEELGEQIKRYLMEITESRKRLRKTQTEIHRLKKKTQAILDKLT